MLEAVFDLPLEAPPPLLARAPGLRAYLPYVPLPHEWSPTQPATAASSSASGQTGASSGSGSGADACTAAGLTMPAAWQWMVPAASLYKPPHGGALRVVALVAKRRIAPGARRARQAQSNALHGCDVMWYPQPSQSVML